MSPTSDSSPLVVPRQTSQLTLGIERRFQVFISSTYRDLVPEREEIVQALLELDCIPAGMELFPASDDDKWSLISKVIADCDYYLVVIAGRYGSVDDEGISYTEREYDLAISLGKPVMAFVHAAPDEIAIGKSDMSPEGAKRLRAFREKAERKMCKTWRTSEELGAVVSRSLVKLMKSHPSTGWVRGDQVLTPEIQAEISELRAQVAELQNRNAGTKVDRETLAQGSDEFVFQYEYAYQAENKVSKVFKGKATYTWDAWFQFLGPSLVNESSERSTKATIMSAITNAATSKKSNPTPDGLVYPDGDSDTQIIIQFLALGLIERSERRRPINDSGTYWTLTPEGRDHLLELRAIRRITTKVTETVSSPVDT